MAKRVRLSANNGTTWYTLPGSSAELTDESGSIDDTVFGQDFQSNQIGLLNTKLTANGVYKGFAGYQATLKKSGTSTTMTGEAMTLVSGKTYKVTDSSKNVWNRAVTLTVKVAGTAVAAANIQYIDYLYGQVTFISSYTVSGAVTVDGAYFPTATIGCANSWTLTQTANANDVSCADVVQANGGVRIYDYGLKTVSLELSGIYKTTNAYRTALAARSEVIVEISPDGSGGAIMRGFFKFATTGQSGDVGAVEQQTVTLTLSVPHSDLDQIPYPIHWTFSANTTLSMAIQIALNAWEGKTIIDAAYLPDGVAGVMGDIVITDVSLQGGIEGMSEFTINGQFSGPLVTYV